MADGTVAKLQVEVEAPSEKLERDMRSVVGIVRRTGNELKNSAQSSLVPLLQLPKLFTDAATTGALLVNKLDQLPTDGFKGLDKINFGRIKGEIRSMGPLIEQFMTRQIDRAAESGFDLQRSLSDLGRFIGPGSSFSMGIESSIRELFHTRKATDDFIMGLRELPGVAQGQFLRGLVLPGEQAEIERQKQVIDEQQKKFKEQMERVRKASAARKLGISLDDRIAITGAATPQARRFEQVRVQIRGLRDEINAVTTPGGALRRELLGKLPQLQFNLLNNPFGKRKDEKSRFVRGEEFDIARSPISRLARPANQPKKKPINEQQGGDMIELLRNIDQKLRANVAAVPVAG